MTTDESWLTPEWMQRGLDSLKATLDVNTDLQRQMIEFLFDTGLWDRSKLNYDSAVTKFRQNLNPGTPTFFRTSEIWALMKRFDRFELLVTIAEDCGFEIHRKPTEQRRQELLERMVLALENSSVIAAEAVAMFAREGNAGAKLRVHPSVREGGASFDLPSVEGF